MLRSACSIVALVAVLGTPALGADWGAEWGGGESGAPDFRTTYPVQPGDWAGLGDNDDPLRFEFGMRYWYSMGAQNFELGGSSVSTQDTAHTGELHLRIDDHSTDSYVKAHAGYSAAILGTYDIDGVTGDVSGGEVGYAGADFGWYAASDGKGSGAGFLVGYQYLNDSPRTERDNYAVVSDASDIQWDDQTGVWSFGVDGVERHIDVHALRLGVSGRAKVGDMFDITAEVAAVPYANVSGQLGGVGYSVPEPCDVPCGPVFAVTSPLQISGWGYGAMGEMMAGFTPTENITIRLGGRAWYLQGTYDASYTGATITPPTPIADPEDPPAPQYNAPIVSTDSYIDTSNPFSMMRYGLLAEFTYAF
jgi:hypothetical protein